MNRCRRDPCLGGSIPTALLTPTTIQCHQVTLNPKDSALQKPQQVNHLERLRALSKKENERRKEKAATGNRLNVACLTGGIKRSNLLRVSQCVWDLMRAKKKMGITQPLIITLTFSDVDAFDSAPSAWNTNHLA